MQICCSGLQPMSLNPSVLQNLLFSGKINKWSLLKCEKQTLAALFPVVLLWCSWRGISCRGPQGAGRPVGAFSQRYRYWLFLHHWRLRVTWQMLAGRLQCDLKAAGHTAPVPLLPPPALLPLCWWLGCASVWRAPRRTFTVWTICEMISVGKCRAELCAARGGQCDHILLYVLCPLKDRHQRKPCFLPHEHCARVLVPGLGQGSFSCLGYKGHKVIWSYGDKGWVLSSARMEWAAGWALCKSDWAQSQSSSKGSGAWGKKLRGRIQAL